MSSDSRHDIDYSTKAFVADFASAFAGVLLLIAATFNILQGLAAIADDELYTPEADYLYDFGTATWGWVHLVIGVLSVAVAVGILVRASWGQVTGIIVAGLAMLTNFASLPHYPLWSIVVIAFDVLVIWALCTQLRNYQ